MNIPIFKAKKLDSDEYIIGYLEEHNTNDFYISLMPNEIDSYKIDTSTLSIHFSDMVDSNGNKIFASLQEFGKGGDVVTDGEYDFVVIFNGRSFDLMFVEDNTFSKFNEWDDWNKFTKKEMQKLTKKETT